MSINSVVNDTVTSESVINALKPLPPTITNYSVGGVDDTALDPAGGQTVQINGTGFLAGATITFDGNAVAVVTFVNANRLTFTSPAKTAGTYTIYAVNPDGGTAIFIPGIIYSVLPTWTTSAGTLGSYYETTNISNTVVASGDAPITYSLYSGSLPTGSTLYANGVITGTAPVDSSSTTYSFTIEAIDAQLQGSTRSFSLTINVDAVTWVSPANNTTYTSAVNSAIANVTLSATDAAGYNVSYSANALPTGLSLSGANISGTPTVIADSSTLLTATAATTNRTAVRTINWSITVANDPYFEYNTLLIPGASTTFVDDASTNNFAVSIFGDTKPNSFNPYTPGYYSNYFDGTGDYISVPDNVAFTMGAGDFTLECWVYLSSVAQQVFIGTCDAPGNQGSMSFILGLNGSAQPYVAVGYAGTMYSSTFSTAVTVGQWYHFAGVRNGNDVNIYVNGVKGGALGMGALAITDSSQVVGIGRNGAGNFEYVTGYISNVRIVKGTAVYTTTFTPPTTPLTAISGTSLLTCQSNRFIDNSANAFTVTVGGNTTVNSFQPFVPNTSYSTYGSGYFDGTGDYLTVPGNSVFAFGTGDFTLEVWLYANSISTGTFDRICATSDYSGSGFDWTLNTSTSSLYVVGTAYSIGSITTKRWHHLVYTRSGSVIRGFLNGNLSSYTTGASQNVSSVTQLNIGAGYSGTPLNGYMVDLRIIKGSIPAGYQTNSTTTGTQIFTPPAEPLTAIANTSLLTLQNNQSVNNNVFLDNSTNNFLVTRNGNTTQGTFSPYGGNWSNYFDGSGDYLTAPNNAAFNFGTGNFTVECWVNVKSFTGSTNVIISTYQDGSNGWTIGIVNNVFYGSVAGDSVEIYSSVTPPVNTWTHLALTRSSTTLSLFVNGVVAATQSNSTNMSTASAVTIGTNVGGGGLNFTGYISNLRVVKGTAVYTSNFTPSTTPLTPIANTSLLTCQSNRIVDASINNFTVTTNGDTSVQRFSPFNPSSLTATSYSGYFDGTGDYLSVPANTALDFRTVDFTIELWVYSPVGFANFADAVISKGPPGDVTYSSWDLQGSGTSGNLRFLGPFSTEYFVTTSQPWLTGWAHIAICRSGSSTKLFVNGTQQGSTYSGTQDFTAGYPVIIGAGFYDPPGRGSNCFISNVRLVKGTAVYTSNFTPSTSPLTAIANTSLLTCQSTTFIDNSTNNFTITAFGNSQPTIQNPFGFTSATTNGYTVSTIGGSGYFDGTGDWLTIPTNTNISFASTVTFTVEFWMYLTAYPVGGGYNDARTVVSTSSTYPEGWRIDISPTSLIWYTYTQGIAITTPISINTWTHVAVTHDGTNTKLYKNGVLAGNANTTWTAGASSPFYIGALNSGSYIFPYLGYISDVRLVKGTQVYTGNFVPPSAPLLAVQNTSLLTNMTSAGIYDAAMMTTMETVGDAKLSTAVSKFGGSSMNFDGSSTCTILANPALTFGTSDFTIEMWVYSASQSSTGNRTIGNGAGAGWGANKWVFTTTTPGNANKFTWQFWNYNSGGADLLVSSSASNNSTWTYVAITRSGNTFRMFVNGVIEATASSSASVDGNIPIQLTLGNSGIAGDSNWTGYLDDLRITRGVARYTSNFSAPTTAFPIY